MANGAGIEPAGHRRVRAHRPVSGAAEHPHRVHQFPEQVKVSAVVFVLAAVVAVLLSFSLSSSSFFFFCCVKRAPPEHCLLIFTPHHTEINTRIRLGIATIRHALELSRYRIRTSVMLIDLTEDPFPSSCIIHPSFFESQDVPERRYRVDGSRTA